MNVSGLLEGKTAIVTGGTRGIGYEIVKNEDREYRYEGEDRDKSGSKDRDEARSEEADEDRSLEGTKAGSEIPMCPWG